MVVVVAIPPRIRRNTDSLAVLSFGVCRLVYSALWLLPKSSRGELFLVLGSLLGDSV